MRFGPCPHGSDTVQDALHGFVLHPPYIHLPLWTDIRVLNCFQLIKEAEGLLKGDFANIVM